MNTQDRRVGVYLCCLIWNFDSCKAEVAIYIDQVEKRPAKRNSRDRERLGQLEIRRLNNVSRLKHLWI